MPPATCFPEQLGFTTAYFDLPGLRMHAAVAGPADGPLLILLHGFPEFWYSWRRQIGPLAQAGFRVVAPDQRGYNLTDKTPPYDTATLSNDIVNLINACGHEQADVVGHDWGAAVAWTLAGLHPERVKCLAILNVPHPAAMAKALLGGNLRQIRKSWYIFYFQIPGLPEQALRWRDYQNLWRLVKSSGLPDTFPASDFTYYRQAWSQPGALPAMLGWYRAIFWQTARRSAPRLGRIIVPTLMLWGERDIALGVETAEESLSYLADGKLIRFPDATHWIHRDKPEEVTQHLLAHFAKG